MLRPPRACLRPRLWLLLLALSGALAAAGSSGCSLATLPLEDGGAVDALLPGDGHGQVDGGLVDFAPDLGSIDSPGGDSGGDLQQSDAGPPHATCGQAQQLTLVNGKATATDSTAGLADELPQLMCGGGVPLAGPQLYYRVALAQGEVYKLTLSPGFAGYLYIFTSAAACQASAIEKDCASGGTSGAFSPLVPAGSTGGMTFSPPMSGAYLVAVDSAGPAEAGSFSFEIELDCSRLDGPCTAGLIQGDACAVQFLTGPCEDGDPCTSGDVCAAGACKGSPVDCSHLSDVCNTGVCSGGSCDAQPQSGPCDDGDPCTSGDKCTGGACKGTPASDTYEPNNSYIGYHITDVSDCAGLDHSLTATLYPPGDIDWYWYSVSDDAGCDIEPMVTLAPPAGTNYQVCAYFECHNGSTVSLSCLSGYKVAGPTSTSAGCCSSETGTAIRTVRLSPECTWLGLGDDSGWVDIKVYAVSGQSCSSYTLKWGDS